MPWKCRSCGSMTELGYNVCIACQASRPGSGPDELQAEIGIPVTTTPSFSTHRIDSYHGPVFGETIYGANAMRDFLAGITNVIGGRSDEYEALLIRGRNTAMAEMVNRATELGANAVVGMRFDYSTVGSSMLMICCVGTAVSITPNDQL